MPNSPARKPSSIFNPQSFNLFLILLIAAFLRFYHLGTSSLWSDEGNTWGLIGRSFGQIARDAAADIHPPGYYWLLKVWSLAFSPSAVGMRSFSAVAGLALVYVLYRLTQRLTADRSIPLLAALLAALNPLQIYYSQEARMYMLLSLAGTTLFWSLLVWQQQEESNAHPHFTRLSACGYLLAGTLGLWTHYSFPMLLAAAGLAWIAVTLRAGTFTWQAIGRFAVLNSVILATFVPWLPTAIARVRAWPKGADAVAPLVALGQTLQTLTYGPLRNLPPVAWLWPLVGGGFVLLGLWALRRQRLAPVVVFWLLVPIVLIFGLGLFSEAFRKFLLVASPAWCIALAALPGGFAKRSKLHYTLTGLIALGAMALAAFTLPAYYNSTTARDNYAGVARYVATLGDSTRDLVLLDAPGQQEVWRYYDPGLPLLTLPQQRPADAAQTIALLSNAVASRRTVFALFWATDEADPQRIVESWLDQHAFKGLDSWQGNLRFVTYSLPNQLECQPLAPTTRFDQRIALLEQCQPAFPQQVAAGEVVLLSLHWQTTVQIAQRYKVSVQLLDARNQVIAQRDSEPTGGSQPTDSWLPGTLVVDNHGITVPPGVPPGNYRLSVVLYNFTTGQRLHTPAGDALPLGEVQVRRPLMQVPAEIIPMQQRVNLPFGPLTLVGYDAHKLGFAHAPATPLQPGDIAEWIIYWQAPSPLPADWPTNGQLTLRLGSQQITGALAGDGYPTGAWRAGELVRGIFTLPYDGSSATPTVQLNTGQIDNINFTLAPLPHD